MGRRSTTIAIVAAAWIAVVACSSEYSGPRSTECSTGPAYGASYPPPGTQSTERNDLPECVPRCGAEQKYSNPTFGDPIYSLAAIPSGACANDGERCLMHAGNVRVCPNESRPCDLSVFECECEDGSWRCSTTARGAGVCGPCESDASADAPSSD